MHQVQVVMSDVIRNGVIACVLEYLVATSMGSASFSKVRMRDGESSENKELFHAVGR